jgi:TorA maturation chaperone TorD
MSQNQIQGGLSGEDWARADFYALLAKLFSGKLDEAFIKGFDQLDKESIDATSPMGFEFQELIRAIGESTVEDIRSEFDTLFVGVGKPDIMLYGSYYLAGFLNEKPLVALRDDLLRLGLEADKKLTETEDHLAFLCEVMRYLILEEDPPLPFDEQVRFFTQHMAPWYGQLCDAIEGHGKARFFKTVGRLTRVFFDIETQSFDFESAV